MPYIRVLPTGKNQVNKDVAFFNLLNGTLPSATQSFKQLFDQFDAIIKLRAKVSTEALSNAHGDWYEWLLAMVSWNYFVNNPTSHLVVLLPNVRQFDVARLYNDDLNALIQDLRIKVNNSSGVQLITSNPDFVVINGDLARTIIPNMTSINSFSISTLQQLNNYYTHFIGQCNFDQIVGYASVKFSLRPDRRLQIPHEGSLMKAIYTHLQTRKWIINPPGLRYYAFSTKIAPPDRDALNTVATHSITTVSSLPQAAVDKVFEVNSLQQAEQAFQQILTV